MAETTSITRACMTCNATYEVKSTRRASQSPRCPECRKQHEKAMQAVRNRRFLDAADASRSDDPVCRTCGKSFKRANPTGQKPKYCPECKLAHKRQLSRETAARSYVKRVPGIPEIFQCSDCKRPFELTRSSGRVSERCRPCQGARNKELANALCREKRSSRVVLDEDRRITTCVVCSVELLNGPVGPPLKRCDECRRELERERGRTRPQITKPRPPRTIVCIDCKKVMIIQGRAASSIKRCPDCAKTAARIIQRRMGQERRAQMRGVDWEPFTAEEIFERDRWKCGLCRKRINKKLKHPHPMSASLDHMIPLTKGGPHTRTNVQATHLTCNLRKYNIGGGEQLLLIG